MKIEFLVFEHKILNIKQNEYTQSNQNKKMTSESVSQISQKVNIFRDIAGLIILRR